MLKFSSVRSMIGNYFYFSKATLCIRGLVFSHSFVNHAVIVVLITLLTDEIWLQNDNNYNQMAAVAVNILNGVSSIMVCFLAYISDTVGPFKVIISTNAAYILGLVLLWVSVIEWRAVDAADTVFYGAGLLLALGEAGRPAALEKFLEDQYSNEESKLPKKETSTEEGKENRQETRQKALWNHPWFLGAAVPLALVNRSWSTQLLVSMIALGVSYLFFWYGVFSYSRNNSPAAEEAQRDQGICQAIKSLSPSEKAPSLKFWLKSNSRKHYYKEILVMCLAFIVYSLVDATGNTFFYDHMNLLDSKIGDFIIPDIYFAVLQSLSSAVISFLWSLLVPNRSKRATFVRIGCGLVCSVLCMIAAWRVEIRRRNKNNISILWLIPQFSLLGGMRGLALAGLIKFFADRDDRNDEKKAKYYGSYASELVLGIGTLLTAVSILGFRQTWLVNDIEKNRLDKYYRALVFIGFANLCYYFCVAVYFYTADDSTNSAPNGNEESEGSGNFKSHDRLKVTSDGAESLEDDGDCCSNFF